MPFLVPDYYFDTYAGATVAFLKEQGIRALVPDIDNTLEPYENPLPTERVIAWLKSLEQNGIKAAIVSNNDSARIDFIRKFI
jgi:predicted HAD superfamily phosphohydrolase YqeG